MAPLGDVNEDGFLDSAIGGGGYDLTTSSGTCATACADAGRLYIYRSDSSSPPSPPAATAPAPPPAPAAVERVTTLTAPTVLAGREIEIEASTNRMVRIARSRRSVRIAGDIDAFANRGACERNQRISMQRRLPGSMRYRTLKFVRTSARGTFATRTLPARTYVYRARLARTSACQGAVSNRERITVITRRSR